MAGIYHVIARADADGNVDEVVDNNTTAVSSPIRIGADLTVALSGPATALPGATIAIAETAPSPRPSPTSAARWPAGRW